MCLCVCVPVVQGAMVVVELVIGRSRAHLVAIARRRSHHDGHAARAGAAAAAMDGGDGLGVHVLVLAGCAHRERTVTPTAEHRIA